MLRIPTPSQAPGSLGVGHLLISTGVWSRGRGRLEGRPKKGAARDRSLRRCRTGPLSSFGGDVPRSQSAYE